MPDIDAFETAYGRLVYKDLADARPGDARPAAPDQPSAPCAKEDTPGSRLMPRLALMAPRAKARRRRAGDRPKPKA